MDKREFVKRYLPGLALLLLIISLMVFFKLNQHGYSGFQSGTTNLISEYTKDLKPLSAKTELTDEDMLNFALYKNLPVDKENEKMLVLENDEEGNENFTIKPASYYPTDNYSKFVNKLELKDEEKKEFDSILSDYRTKIDKSILYNEQNSMAVNSNIGIVHKAMSEDIYNFAVRKSEWDRSAPLEKQERKETRVYNEILDRKNEIGVSNYIFVAPDTVFKYQVEWESSVPEEVEISSSVHSVTPPDPPVAVHVAPFSSSEEGRELNLGIEYEDDSAAVKVHIPKTALDHSHTVLLEPFTEVYWNLADVISNIEVERQNEGEISIQLDSMRNVNFEFNFSGLESLIENSGDAFSEAEGWEEFGLKIDSVAKVIQFYAADSLIKVKVKESKLKKAEKKDKNK